MGDYRLLRQWSIGWKDDQLPIIEFLHCINRRDTLPFGPRWLHYYGTNETPSDSPQGWQPHESLTLTWCPAKVVRATVKIAAQHLDPKFGSKSLSPNSQCRGLHSILQVNITRVLVFFSNQCALGRLRAAYNVFHSRDRSWSSKQENILQMRQDPVPGNHSDPSDSQGPPSKWPRVGSP